MTCPHPEKVVYRSERAARRAIYSMQDANRDGQGFLHAYRCGGHWHVCHGRKTRQRTFGRKFR